MKGATRQGMSPPWTPNRRHAHAVLPAPQLNTSLSGTSFEKLDSFDDLVSLGTGLGTVCFGDAHSWFLLYWPLSAKAEVAQGFPAAVRGPPRPSPLKNAGTWGLSCRDRRVHVLHCVCCSLMSGTCENNALS